MARRNSSRESTARDAGTRGSNMLGNGADDPHEVQRRVETVAEKARAGESREQGVPFERVLSFVCSTVQVVAPS